MANCKKCGNKGLTLHVNLDGLCDTCQHFEVENLRSQLSPEITQLEQLRFEITSLTNQKAEMDQQMRSIAGDLRALWSSLEEKKAQIVETDEKILMQEFGLYEPKYDFCNVEAYKNRLDLIRQRQKEMVKAGMAATGNTNWSVNNSASQGAKMVKDMQKLLIRAFNSECGEVVSKVKYNNYEASLKRISASRDAISKLGTIMAVSVTKPYYDLKIDELTLALEFQQRKQREKEEQQAVRAQMREEAKLQREIEESRKKAEKEKAHYLNTLSRLETQIASASEEAKVELLQKKADLELQIQDVDKAIKDIDYREANQRAGYVYIISNIGSFGENVYKIGMTRRLDPTERVDELGDASVPFCFDIHAMIFSDDAPALEAALHKAFDHRKLNMVNNRKEFFHVSLEEIKAEVQKNYDKTAEFIEIADAEQYRVSNKIRQSFAQ